MTTLVVLSVVDIVLLIGVLAGYLYVVGTRLSRIAATLEQCRDLVHQIGEDAGPILPGVHHINRTGGVVAGALPLLYGMAEGIVAGTTFDPVEARRHDVARPASGVRRSRLHHGVGYDPEGASGSRPVPSGPVVGAE